MKKKIIWFIIIILIVAGGGYFIYYKNSNTKIESNYSLSNKETNKVINLVIYSKAGIKEVELPNGDTKTYNGKTNVNIKYTIKTNGNYRFTITDENDKTKVKVIKVTSFEDVTTTTKKVTTTKKTEYIKTDNNKTNPETISTKLKSLVVFDENISLSDKTDYYIYYSGSETTANIKYTLVNSKALATLVNTKINTGENLAYLTITNPSGEKTNYNIHIIKYDLNIFFTGSSISKNDINVLVDTNLTGTSNKAIISKIEYNTSNINTNKPTEYLEYNNGILLNSNSYIFVRVTMSNGDVYYKVSDKYIVDKIAPTITPFNNITDGNLAPLNQGLLTSSDIVYSTIDETTSYVGIGLNKLTQLNIKKLNATLTITASDNESTNLEYSYLVSTSNNITNESEGWSAWQTSNVISLTNLDQINNTTYIGIRVKDKAGNIANTIYYLPSYLNAASTTKYYDLDNSTSYRLPVLDSCSKKIITANLYYGTTLISNENALFCTSTCPSGYVEYQNTCVTSCPENTTLNEGICEAN